MATTPISRWPPRRSGRKRRAKLVISGEGKSGIVARKIAATFSSVGLTTVFLNSVDALHGILGAAIVCNQFF